MQTKTQLPKKLSKSLYGAPTKTLRDLLIEDWELIEIGIRLGRMVKEDFEIKEAIENTGYAEQYLKLVEMHSKMPKIIQKRIEKKFTKEQLDTLEWAKEFMERYERKQSLLERKKHG